MLWVSLKVVVGYGCYGINLICFCCQGNTLVLEVWAVSLDLRYCAN